MSDDDDDNDASVDGFVGVTEALEGYSFTLPQLRALVSAGVVRTKRDRGKLIYCVEDLERLAGAPRNDEPDDAFGTDIKALLAGHERLNEMCMKLVKQCQDHERQLVTAFNAPLKTLAESSQNQVKAVLDQNTQLVERANAGDKSRLEFVQAAETMLRDQRAELRDQAELDRKHELRREMWEGVKKAAPKLLEGFKETMGTDRLEAAAELGRKLDPAKVAAILQFGLLPDDQIDLLCKALGLDRAELEKLNREADAAAAAEAAATTPEAAE